jgi:hypothetical protein
MVKTFLLVVLSLLTFSSAGGQNLPVYDWQEGQILEFSYRCFHPDTLRPNDPEVTWEMLLRFKVKSRTGSHYNMSCEFLFNESRTYWKSRLTDRYSYLTPYNSEISSKILCPELNSVLEFRMSNSGKILGFKNLDKIKTHLFEWIKSDSNLGLQLNIPYTLLETRLSEEYYSQLINQIFPELTGLSSMKPFIQEYRYSKENIITNFQWTDRKTADPHVYWFSRTTYKLPPSTGLETFILQSDTSGSATWNPFLHCFEIQVYQGIDWLRTLMNYSRPRENGIWNNPFVRLNLLGEITIRLMNFETKDNHEVIISGNCWGPQEYSIITKSPSPGIVPITKEDHYDYSNFSITRDLPFGYGLIFLEFKSDKKYDEKNTHTPKRVLVFAKPQDTINLKINLKNHESQLEFSGKRARELAFLNANLNFLYDSNDYQGPIDFNEIDSEYLRLRGSFSEEFCRWFEFELKYHKLIFRLKQNTATLSLNKEVDLVDCMSYFQHHLGNPDGFRSEMYQNFISQFVFTFSKTANTAVENDPIHNLVNTSKALLGGWDRYYYLARLCNSRLSQFYNPLTEELYLNFQQDYRETSFANILKAKWEANSLSLPGIPIPSIDFNDFKGISHNLLDFKGKVLWIFPWKEIWEFSNLNFLYKRQATPEWKNIVILTTYIGGDPVDAAREIRTANLIGYHISDSAVSHQILRAFGNRPDLQIFINKDQKIAGYVPKLNNAPQLLDNLVSWQTMSNSNTKTVSLSLFWYFTGGFVLVGLLLFISIKKRNKRREAQQVIKRRIAELELDAVRLQMNPHFMFNALSSIQSLINQNRIKEANLSLSRFGDLVRTIMEQSNYKEISLNEEIDMLHNFLKLGQLRYSYEYEIIVESTIDPYSTEIPTMLLQPHVENAIQHGIAPKNSGGFIRITFQKDIHTLICSISDNGPNSVDLKESLENNHGRGWLLTRQRIELIRERFGKNIAFDITSSKESQGTVVIFKIPMHKNNV